MSSEISTNPTASSTGGFQAWHLYLLLGMAGATAAVLEARDTQPASLLLLSAAVLAAGAIAIAVHYSVLAFMGEATLDHEPIDVRTRAALEQEKAIVLRSIKELEFDRAMGKVSQVDYNELNGRLRARAMTLMEQIEAADVARETAARHRPSPGGPAELRCPACRLQNDADARFCKSCGQKLR